MGVIVLFDIEYSATLPVSFSSISNPSCTLFSPFPLLLLLYQHQIFVPAFYAGLCRGQRLVYTHTDIVIIKSLGLSEQFLSNSVV